VVKLWKGTALGDIKREAPRILAFLERAQSHIESPVRGTVALRNIHWTGDAIVLVQDLVEGPTLLDEIALKNRLSEPGDALQFFRELADAVNVLHDRSLAHGDLKPANVVVSSRDGATECRPVLIDLFDFSSQADGERMSTAYAPPSGGRFERDRFAVTRMVEEVIGTQQIKGGVWADITRAIDQCRIGPPENSTLLPLMEALDRALNPDDFAIPSRAIEVSIVGADAGPMLSDEGMYWISRFGVDINLRGAAEKLEIRLDSTGKPVMARRVQLGQSAIQRNRRFPGR
jgi:serine/threonine protein kinase